MLIIIIIIIILGMIMWCGIFIANFVVNVDWKELVTEMNRILREWCKVKTSKYYGILQSSATRKSRHEDQIAFIRLHCLHQVYCN